LFSYRSNHPQQQQQQAQQIHPGPKVTHSSGKKMEEEEYKGGKDKRPQANQKPRPLYTF